MNSPGLDSLNLGLRRRTPSGEGGKGEANARTDSGRRRNLAEQAAAVQSLAVGVCGAQRRRCLSSTCSRSSGGRKRGAAVGSTSEDKGGTNASHFYMVFCIVVGGLTAKAYLFVISI